MPHLVNVACIALLLTPLASPVAAQAPRPADRLSPLRARLHVYDVRPEGTPAVIRALGQLVGEGPQAGEARFLRAIATTDLLIIARRRRDPALTERRAAAFGVEPDALAGALRTELEALRTEPYLATVDDALSALAPDEGLAIPPAGTDHTRQQATFFMRVLDQLLRARDATRVLVDLAVADPCGEARECAPPHGHFGPRGRRAIAGMTALHALLRSIERTAELGDPFTAALAREVLVDTVVLRSISLAPRDFATSVRPVAAPTEGAPLDVDAVVVIGRDRVRAGWAPEVSWDREGRPSVMADGPLLGSREEVSFPLPAAPGVGAIPELAVHVGLALRGASRVALMVEPGVEAHLLSRVLVSLEEAGERPGLLAVATADGSARGVAFERAAGEESTVGVFVRLGGFSAWQPGQHVSLPRQRTAEGWAFDFEGLRLATVARARHQVSVRFMGTVAADLVLRVALALASDERPLRLVVR